MQIEQTFTIARAPEDVFAFVADPDKLARWQTIKTSVTPLTDGPLRVGARVREGNRIGPRAWDQTVEVTEFEPARVFAVKVIEGPASSGRWTMRPGGDGTRVHFEAQLAAPRLLQPLLAAVARRQFRRFHENLRRELEEA